MSDKTWEVMPDRMPERTVEEMLLIAVFPFESQPGEGEKEERTTLMKSRDLCFWGVQISAMVSSPSFSARKNVKLCAKSLGQYVFHGWDHATENRGFSLPNAWFPGRVATIASRYGWMAIKDADSFQTSLPPEKVWNSKGSFPVWALMLRAFHFWYTPTVRFHCGRFQLSFFLHGLRWCSQQESETKDESLWNKTRLQHFRTMWSAAPATLSLDECANSNFVTLIHCRSCFGILDTHRLPCNNPIWTGTSPERFCDAYFLHVGS